MNSELVIKYLRDLNIDCYLVYDFRKSNPVGRRIINFDVPTTRRWLALFTKQGKIYFVIPKLEETLFNHFKVTKYTYTTYQELISTLGNILKNYKTVALEYSENNNLSVLDNVPAGFLELIKQIAPPIRILSSANLTQYIVSSWGKNGLASHKKAAKKLKEIADQAIQYIKTTLDRNETITDYQACEFVLGLYKKNHLITEDALCVVSTNQRTGNPHYWPTKDRNYIIKKNSVLLLDLWAKLNQKNSIYADITIMAWIGPKAIPSQVKTLWDIVKESRNRGISFVKNNVSKNIMGFEVDKEVRSYIRKKGFGEYFIHRTGHSIDTADHGSGVNLDDYESHDTRLLIPNTGFSIEPGIYTKDFGIRSEINVYINPDKKVEVTTFLQDELIII